jgi:outer membrane protein OmpA-like peptidoglycan-associated protein
MTPHMLIARPFSCIRPVGVVAFFIILFTCFTPLESSAQNFHWGAYKKRTKMYSKACDLPKRRGKKSHKPRKPTKYVAERNVVLSNYSKTTPQPKPKPAPTEVAQTEHKVEKVDDKKLEQLHHQEDDVLAKNKLPQPTSEKHEQVRKMVAEKVKNKPNSEPVKLAPLYFTFAEDEFAIVDMEPFLIAVEYALQGHTILIEGHTDNLGADNYNVQLSIKRVQRIRQLMLDMGVPDDRISVVGYGEEMKKNDNKTNEGRQLNRRVDFTAF